MNKDRTLLTDEQWERLSPRLPGHKHAPGMTARDTRRFIEAVLWRTRCGVSWRDLPTEQFGPWHTVYTRYRRWCKTGVWQRVLSQVQEEKTLHRLLADSTAACARLLVVNAN
ncbi:transposase [uncultured Hymenobacter sp.]|uniref:transposase n=1 Tax=uncultured Hymenobacter sp. TaxID=170016 RepID=UPI0035CA84C2